MSSSVSDSIETLLHASSAAALEQAVVDLAGQGASAIPDLIALLRAQPTRKTLRAPVIRAIAKMGYPENAAGIPVLVAVASDPNSPGWGIAVDALVDIGAPAGAEFESALIFYMRDYCEYAAEIQSLCSVIERLDGALVARLAQPLVALLQIGTPENHIDEYALGALGRLESPPLELLPALEERITSDCREQVRIDAIHMLVKFDRSAVGRLLPLLEQLLLEGSDKMTATAAMVLEQLRQ